MTCPFEVIKGSFMKSFPYLATCLVLAFFAAGLLAAETAGSTPELKTETSTKATYYISLPKGWSAEKTWPVVVTIDGSGHNFAANAKGFANARGERPFIIVTPCVSSNGNDPADMQATLAIVKEVQAEFKGQPTFFMTGFSAGGHLTWQVVFNHPELLAGAVLAAANFRFRGVETISKAPEAATLPIHGIQGDKDQYVTPLTQQWNDALEIAAKNGYKTPTRTVVAGAGHNPFAKDVLNYFESLHPK
jgi:poly(3-hydroxybutyrate) depolymerase